MRSKKKCLEIWKKGKRKLNAINEQHKSNTRQKRKIGAHRRREDLNYDFRLF